MCVKNWSSDMKSVLLSINKLNAFETLEAINNNGARNLLTQKMNEKWKTDILSNTYVHRSLWQNTASIINIMEGQYNTK